MPDPFLLAHEVAEFVFDIGGKQAPISVRDQMVRGQSIVDRALATSHCDTGGLGRRIAPGRMGTIWRDARWMLAIQYAPG
jgi:hypothetical protein